MATHFRTISTKKTRASRKFIIDMACEYSGGRG